MTDLKSTTATLIIDDKVAGRLYVRDAGGRLLVELRKEPLYPVQLGLGPGRYQVSLDADGRPFEAQVLLSEGRSTRLGTAQFVPQTALVADRRGGPPTVVGAATTPPASLPYRHVPFEGVLAPGVRSGGSGPEPVLNNFVIGIIGHSHALEGMQLSLGGNLVEQRMRGVQLSSGFNMTRGPSVGVQIGAAANVALDGFRGVQIASGANVARGEVRGFQASVVNWANNDLHGAQVGVANWTRGNYRGPQIGTTNVISGQMQGLQLAVVNVGGTVEGAQIGVVNIANHVHGLQLGVVNLGRSVDGASVGIISAIGDGYRALQLWSSDLSPLNLGFKLGSRHVYTLLGFGIGREEARDRAIYAPQIGLGVHTLPFGPRFFLDIEAVATSFHRQGEWGSHEENVTSTLRLVAGVQIAKHLAVTLGPTLSVDVRENTTGAPRPGLGWLERTVHQGDDVEVRLFPGFVAGLQL